MLCGNHRITLSELFAAGASDGHRFIAERKAYLSPRTVAFNVQGIRLAVHRVTGEVRILHSVHAADIGRLINPMQCRGQIDGAIGMAIGWALTENMVHDDERHGGQPSLRNYRIPAFADSPFSEDLSPIPTTGSARSAPNRRVNARSIRSRRRSPMPLADATGVRFPTCRSRPTVSSPSSVRHERDARGQGPVTVVAQTRRAAGEGGRHFGQWQARPARRMQPGFIEQSVMPPIRRADRLGDPATFRHPGTPSPGCVRRARSAGPKRSTCWSASTTCTSCATSRRPMPAPVSAVITTRVKPGQETEFRPGNSASRAKPSAPGFQGYRFEPPIPGVQDDGSPSCASTRGPSCRAGSTRRNASAARGGAVHRGIPRARGAQRVRAMVPDGSAGA